ncbi:MAG: aminotransferase class III-fold pyridoxal phosphate-dependent enzyme, partial [Vulcanimicrobiaceae bacterium]
EALPRAAAERGAQLMTALHRISSEHIVDVRGNGLLIGIELDVPARPYCITLAEHGVLAKETRERTIRICPPLIITKDEIDLLGKRITTALLP